MRDQAQEQVRAAQRAKDVAFQIRFLAGQLNDWAMLVNHGTDSLSTLAYVESGAGKIEMVSLVGPTQIESLNIYVTVGAKMLQIRPQSFAYGDDLIAFVSGPVRKYELRLADQWGVYRQRRDSGDGPEQFDGPAPLDDSTISEMAAALFSDDAWR